MKIISLKCNNCSADLEIPEKTKFFRCSFCNSSLGIKHSGNAVFTEVLEEIKTDTSQILDTTEAILVERKIARLDRDWEQTKESFTTYSKEGIPSLPNSGSPILSFVVFLIFAFLAFLLFFFLRGASNDSMPFLLIIIAFPFIILSAISSSSSTKKYNKARSTYGKKRQQLLQELNGLE